ncbi:MarR family winged helix-turn-helix transcriptional regulator [Lactobacillus xylocopicola]|uniref:HTH marR-type domain-containing protein n=1 Tax=Lactobacillus xylocopicola TaxID=2976676 RepID=A0ABM8BG00_9LACO|nr:MarR family winged helix-turn-helix transcriptional regulator [Lactobacillus xylocopicola]BDR60164.1 hypothetical protein KIM322_04250 [Lactobacillus xylocopicola]
MSQTSDKLMKQLSFVMRASRYFMFENKQPISGQKRVLAVLKLGDGLTQNYLAEILALRPGSLAELLKKLELKGDIRRETDDQDKRVKRVYLTEAGKKEASLLDQEQKEYDTATFFAGLNEDEQAELSKSLEKISNGWDEGFRKQTQRFVDPTYRMKALAKWHKFSDQQDYRTADMQDMRRKMRAWRHEFKREDFPENHHKCAKIRQYDQDFWQKFWDNKNEES